MDRNRKYQNNYFSQPNLYDGTYMAPQPFSRIQYQMSPRPELKRDIPMNEGQLQNSLVLRNPSYQKDYQFVHAYNSQSQLSDTQGYLASIYGKRKERPLNPQYSQSMLRQRQRLQNVVLPRIIMSHQKCVNDRQKGQIKMLRQLQDRYQRLQPQMEMVYNREKQNYQMHQRQYQQQLQQWQQQQWQMQHSFQQFNGCHQCARENRIERNTVQHKPKNYPKNDNAQSQRSQKSKNQQKFQKTPEKPRVSPQRRKKLLSKFRVYGYAVYFAVIFPHYSYLFGHFKLKQFLQNYLIEDNKYIRHMNQQLQEKFKEIPLYESIRAIHQGYEDENFNAMNNITNKKDDDPKIKIANQLGNENYVINLNVFRNIIAMMLNTYSKFVDGLDEDELQFLGVGMLNTSYYGDQIYSIEQLPFIDCHLEKGNIKVNKKQQRALLLSNFIIKRVIYQNLIRLAVDPSWHEEMATFSSLKPHEVQFFKVICKEIQLAAIFFYEIAIKNFYILIDPQKQGNFLQIADSAIPLPLKTMKFPSLFMTNSEKQIFNYGFGHYMTRTKSSYKKINKHKNSQGTVQKFNSMYDWNDNEKEIFDQYTELIQDDPLNLIHNSSQFGELSKIISQFMKPSYEKVQKSLMKIVENLFNKVSEKKRKNYKQYHERVMRKKYILTKEHEILQGIVFLRNEEEMKIVAMSRKMLEIYIQTLEEHEFQARDRVNTLSSRKQMIKSKDKKKNMFSKGKVESTVSIMKRENSKSVSFSNNDEDKNNDKSSQLMFKRNK